MTTNMAVVPPNAIERTYLKRLQDHQHHLERSGRFSALAHSLKWVIEKASAAPLEGQGDQGAVAQAALLPTCAEDIARIIDPKAWDRWDSQKADIDRLRLGRGPHNDAILNARTYVQESMEKANAILAALRPSPDSAGNSEGPKP